MVATSDNVALATINALLVLASLGCMSAGRRSIRRARPGAHRAFMLAASGFQAAFVPFFVYRFVVHGPTAFQGRGPLQWIYHFIVFTHEPLAVIVTPLVIAALVLALAGQLEAHRLVVRFAYPIWLYVSVSGIALYFLLYAWPAVALLAHR